MCRGDVARGGRAGSVGGRQRADIRGAATDVRSTTMHAPRLGSAVAGSDPSARRGGPVTGAWRVPPYLLIALSLAVTLAAGDAVVPSAVIPWVVAATIALVAVRVAWQSTSSRGLRTGILVVHLLVLLAAVCLSGFFAIAAFAAYLDVAELGSHRRFVPVVAATGAISGLGQAGGPHGLAEWPVFVATLVVVNIAIGVAMMLLDWRRRATLDELAQTVDELRASERRTELLRERVVAQARVAGVLEERQRLAREMHDTVAQGLVAVITQLEGADAAVSGSAEQRGRLELAQASARESLGEVRRAVQALASPRLDDADLPQALERLVEGWSAQHGVDATVHVDGADDDLAAIAHDADLLRVAQESLANVARHATASRVVVTLTAMDDGTRLDVRDDGRGFDARANTSGHGIEGMRRRVVAIGGSLAVETAPGEGCTVSAAVPA